MVSVPRRRLARYLLADGPSGKEGDIDGHRTLADPFVFAASAPAGPQILFKIEGAVNNRFKVGDQVFKGGQFVGTIAQNTDWDRQSPLQENTHLRIVDPFNVPGSGWSNQHLTVQPQLPADDVTYGWYEVSAEESEELAMSSMRFEDAKDFRFKVNVPQGGGKKTFEHKNDTRTGIDITGPLGETQLVVDVAAGQTVEILFSADAPVDDNVAEFLINGDDVLVPLVSGEGSYLMPLDAPANFQIKGTDKYKSSKPLHVKIRIPG